MKGRMVLVFVLSVGLVLLTLVIAGQTNQADNAGQLPFLSNAYNHHTENLHSSTALGCTSEITFTPAFTVYLPLVSKNLSRPWTLVGAIAKLPEVHTEAVTPGTIEQYIQLLSSLSEEAQWWITDIGWGLEDLLLNVNEVALLELLAEKNVPTVMSLLTSPSIIDGVTASEVTWAQGYEVESLSALLQNDIDELLTQGLLSDEGRAGIERLIEMATTNFEIAKGLYLIDNFGHPDFRMFVHSVPEYNTQLHVLGQLADRGIPEGYEVAAVAAALDYGSLWTIADDEVRTLIPEYSHNMILFQAETDPIIRQNGASGQAKDFPLEAQIAIVWGGPGNYYPLTEAEAERIERQIEPFASWSGYREVFSGRPMSREDFNFVFVEKSNLIEMRNYLFENDLFDPNPDRLSSAIFHFAMEDNLDYQWQPTIQSVDGWSIYNAYICNGDWQWIQFKDNGKFVGSSGDAYVHTYLLKSLNSSGITPSKVAHQSGYYDPFEENWKVSTAEMSLPGSDNIDERFGWNKVPYDNFWLNPLEGNWTGRMRILIPLRTDVVWLAGLPKGYIFRADVSAEPFP